MPPTDTSSAKLTLRPLPADTSSTSLTKPLIDTHNAKSQDQSPLFGRIPGEIRNHIFDLALTAYPGKQEPFERSAYHCRPHFRYADMRIDTDLLLTCRRVYGEARLVPTQNYEHVDWDEGTHAPSAQDERRYHRRPKDSRYDDVNPWVTSLHLFAQQGYLQNSWCHYLRYPPKRALRDLRNFKMTIRHCDWYSFATGDPLVLDAKQERQPSVTRYSKATDEFQRKSWGRCFMIFTGPIKRFELELETVEEQREELDEIVSRAADWALSTQKREHTCHEPGKN